MDAEMQRAKGAWIGRGMAEPGTGGEIGNGERQRDLESGFVRSGAMREREYDNGQDRYYGEADPPDSPRMRLEQHAMHGTARPSCGQAALGHLRDLQRKPRNPRDGDDRDGEEREMHEPSTA